MKLLIINCGFKYLPDAIHDAVSKGSAANGSIYMMTINLAKFNRAMFKKTLMDFSPTTIILIPPECPTWLGILDELTLQLEDLLLEVTRAISIFSGKLILISSVDVLGDATSRTENSVITPYSVYGDYLYIAETQIQGYANIILRIPLLTTNDDVLELVKKSIYRNTNENSDIPNCLITLADPKEIAKVVDRYVLESGTRGIKHITPNDSIELAQLIECNKEGRTIDSSLGTSYKLEKLSTSMELWKKTQEGLSL